MATAAAAVTLGISVELVVTAISALGIGIVGAVLTGKALEQIREWIRTRDISTDISDHVMNKKHDFNDRCKQDCILSVARNIKVHSSWLADNGIPILEELDIVEMDVKLRLECQFHFFNKIGKLEQLFIKDLVKLIK